MESNDEYSLLDLPYERLYDIALNMDFNTLINFCQTNRFLSQICEDNRFWRLKFEHDFGFRPKEKGYIDWKLYYELYADEIRKDQIDKMLEYSSRQLQSTFEQLVIDYINYNTTTDYF